MACCPKHVVRAPADLARDVNIELIAAPLPDDLTHMTDGQRVFYRWHPDPARGGWRLYRGVAEALLTRADLDFGPTDAWAVAAHLAAPPLLVHRVGIREVLRQQIWAPADQIRLWWRVRKTWP